MSEVSKVSLGSIAERAEKLEAEKPAETSAESTVETTEPAKTEPVLEKKTEPAKTEPVLEKKVPNDPDELRKWNTKVSMELSDVKKQLQLLAESLNKVSKKPVDWKELAKDPAKLQAAVEAQQKEAIGEVESKYNEQLAARDHEIVESEKERRLHDPKYPRWGELMPKMISLAVNGDRRIDFTKPPKQCLDQMYEVASSETPAGSTQAAPVSATGPKTFSEADIAAAKEEARKEALAEAQKGLAAEQKGASVAGMGKSAQKGKGSDVKDAAWKMPLSDLKAALQQASDK